MSVPIEIQEKINALGVGDWVYTLNRWEEAVDSNMSSRVAGMWYITDMRHLANLASPNMQGYITDDTPQEKQDALIELGWDIYDWIEEKLEIEEDY